MFAGANIKCLSYAAFFGYFLDGTRKYRLRQGQIEIIDISVLTFGFDGILKGCYTDVRN